MSPSSLSLGSRATRAGVFVALAALVASAMPLPLSSAADIPSYPIGQDQHLGNAGVNAGYVISCDSGGCAGDPAIQKATSRAVVTDETFTRTGEALVGYQFKLHRVCDGQSTLAPFSMTYDYDYTYSQVKPLLVHGATSHTVRARVFADDTVFTTAATTPGSGSGSLLNVDVDVNVVETYEASLSSFATATMTDNPLVNGEQISATGTVTQGGLTLDFTDPLDPEVVEMSTVPAPVNGGTNGFLGFVNTPGVRFAARATDPSVGAGGQNVIQSCVRILIFETGGQIDSEDPGFSQGMVSSSYVFTGEGKHDAVISAKDYQNRESPAVDVNFILDSVDPGTDIDPSPATPTGKNGWYFGLGPAIWQIACIRDIDPNNPPLSTETAPCDQTDVSENGGSSWLAMGAGESFTRGALDGASVQLKGRSRDRANNLNDGINSAIIKVDTVLPTISKPRSTPSEFGNGWHKAATTLDFQCVSDATSGCAGGIIETRTDNGAWTGTTRYECLANVDRLLNDIDYGIEDEAGNRAAGSEFFGCDFVNPEVPRNLRITSPTYFNEARQQTYSNVTPTFTWDAAVDPVTNGVASGIHHYEVKLDGVVQPPVSGTSFVPATTDGFRCVTVRPVDNAGNRGPVTPTPSCIFIDRVKPNLPWNLPEAGKIYHNGRQVSAGTISGLPLPDGALVIGKLLVGVDAIDPVPAGGEQSNVQDVHLIQDAGLLVEEGQHEEAPAVCFPPEGWTGENRLDGDCIEPCDDVNLQAVTCSWNDRQIDQQTPSVDTRHLFARTWDNARNVKVAFRNYTRVDLGLVENTCNSVQICNQLLFAPPELPFGIEFLSYLIERRIIDDPLLGDWHIVSTQPSITQTSYVDASSAAATATEDVYEYRVKALDSTNSVIKAYNKVRIQPNHVRGHVGEMYT